MKRPGIGCWCLIFLQVQNMVPGGVEIPKKGPLMYSIIRFILKFPKEMQWILYKWYGAEFKKSPLFGHFLIFSTDRGTRASAGTGWYHGALKPLGMVLGLCTGPVQKNADPRLWGHGRGDFFKLYWKPGCIYGNSSMDGVDATRGLLVFRQSRVSAGSDSPVILIGKPFCRTIWLL